MIREATGADLPLLAELARTTYRASYGQEMGEAATVAHIERVLNDAAIAQMFDRDVFLIELAVYGTVLALCLMLRRRLHVTDQ